MDFLSRNFRRVIFSGTPCIHQYIFDDDCNDGEANDNDCDKNDNVIIIIITKMI